MPLRRPTERTWPWTLDAARAGSKDKLLAGGELADFLLAGAERCLVLLSERLEQHMFDARHVSRRCVWRAREVGLELDKEWLRCGDEGHQEGWGDGRSGCSSRILDRHV